MLAINRLTILFVVLMLNQFVLPSDIGHPNQHRRSATGSSVFDEFKGLPVIPEHAGFGSGHDHVVISLDSSPDLHDADSLLIDRVSNILGTRKRSLQTLGRDRPVDDQDRVVMAILEVARTNDKRFQLAQAKEDRLVQAAIESDKKNKFEQRKNCCTTVTGLVISFASFGISAWLAFRTATSGAK